MNAPPSHRAPASPHESAADERELAQFEAAQDPRDLEAATWAARRRNGMSAADKAGLKAWLDADPANADALQDMEEILGQVQQLPEEEVASLRAALPAGPMHTAPATAPPTLAAPSPAVPAPLRWLQGLLTLVPQAAAAAVAFALVGGGWMGWEHWRALPTFEQAYKTARGQQLSVGLPDLRDAASRGTTLQLDTATQVQARLYRDRREVLLQDGQAMFNVAADTDRPFHVRAGQLRITVVGTRFSVRHTSSGVGAGQTVVSVEEGHVRVATLGPGDGAPAADAPAAADTASVELTAGQMVSADADGHLGPVASVAPTAIAPWRSGRISFDQTPLAQAVAEFERYGRTGLVVSDPTVAALPVGGSYSVRQFQRFADTLPQLLPVRLVAHGESTEVVAR